MVSQKKRGTGVNGRSCTFHLLRSVHSHFSHVQLLGALIKVRGATRETDERRDKETLQIHNNNNIKNNKTNNCKKKCPNRSELLPIKHDERLPRKRNRSLNSESRLLSKLLVHLVKTQLQFKQ